jgi:hypothetical protein
MGNRTLKVTAKLLKHGSSEEIIEEFHAVVADDEKLDEIVQMNYGCWYNVVSYEVEPAIIAISNKAIKGLVSELINNL